MAIEICKPGTMYREIGNVIGKYIEENGLEPPFPVTEIGVTYTNNTLRTLKKPQDL